jgi:ribosome biogenesis GTPase
MPSREEKMWQHYRAEQSLRKVRKEVKRNRKPKRVRPKDWNLYSYDDMDTLDEVDIAQDERVMPRGERERRRTNLKTALTRVETDEDEIAAEAAPGEDALGQAGVVVEVASGVYRVDLGKSIVLCSLRGSLTAGETGYTNVVAVGDRVTVSRNGRGEGVIEAVLSRRSVLARPDVFRTHLQQVIVANADQLLIVASWREPHIWLELIDRYLIAAARHNLWPLICVNKIDLAEDMEACRSTLAPYQKLGYQLILTSALTGAGVGELRKALSRQTTVLAGLSGVGKSSLLTAVQPDLQLRTGTVSEQSGEGRHTTTQVVMHRLAAGGFVVDTPGIREFGLAGLRQSELARFYPEIQRASANCRFSDCSHIHEPECAVKAAVEDGRMSPERYHSYTKIYESLPA